MQVSVPFRRGEECRSLSARGGGGTKVSDAVLDACSREEVAYYTMDWLGSLAGAVGHRRHKPPGNDLVLSLHGAPPFFVLFGVLFSIHCEQCFDSRLEKLTLPDQRYALELWLPSRPR